MAGPDSIKREVERVTRATHAELHALAEQFKTTLRALVSQGGDPEGMRERIAYLVADYERGVRTLTEKVRTEIEARFPPPSGTQQKPQPRRSLAQAPRDLDQRPPRSRPLSRKRRPRRPQSPGAGVPVEPNRPNNLSGGAAAPLEFD